ncbi:hypothetical protein Hanom_Chr17g01558221 [Helianthus anomalus]
MTVGYFDGVAVAYGGDKRCKRGGRWVLIRDKWWLKGRLRRSCGGGVWNKVVYGGYG